MPAPAATAPVASDTRATVAGVTVDLLGMAENQSTGKPWYGPDGRPLAKRPYDRPGVQGGGSAETAVREFAFNTDRTKVSRWTEEQSPNAATIRLSAERSTGRIFSRLTTPIDGDNDVTDGRLCVTLRGPAGKPMTAAFEVAAGPWVPRIVGRRDADVTIVAQDDVRSARLTQSFEDEDGSASVGYRLAQFYSMPDVRLVAIDTGGRVHLPRIKSWDYRPPQERAAEPVLDVELPAMRLNNVRFGNLVDTLQEQTGLTINVDWPSLKAVEIDETTPVTTRAAREPLYHWLPYVFQSVRGLGEPTFDVKDGVVTIGAYGRFPVRPSGTACRACRWRSWTTSKCRRGPSTNGRRSTA